MPTLFNSTSLVGFRQDFSSFKTPASKFFTDEGYQNTKPTVAVDFVKNVYGEQGNKTNNISDFATFDRAGHATMIDENGVLKWAPHNIVPDSENLSLNVTESDVTLTRGFMGPNGRKNAVHVQKTTEGDTFLYSSLDLKEYHYKKIWARTVSGTGTVALLGYHAHLQHHFTLTEEWQLFEVENCTECTGGVNFYYVDFRYGSLDEVLIAEPECIRFDLGGTADNPATQRTYVPTSGTPVYLPRVGHHSYENGEWVNKGLLIESAAATNLVTTDRFGGFSGLTYTVGSDPKFGEGVFNLTNPEPDLTGYLRARVNIEVGKTYCASFYIKPVDTGEYFYTLFHANAFGNDAADHRMARFNPVLLESIQTGGEIVAKGIIPQGDGWYFCYSSCVATATDANAVIQIFREQPGTFAGADIVGLQVEEGAIPSSHVPIGSTVTTNRLAETMSFPVYQPGGTTTFRFEGSLDYYNSASSDEATLLLFAQGGSGGWLRVRLRTDGANPSWELAHKLDPTTDTDASITTTSYSDGLGVPFSVAGYFSDTGTQVSTEGSVSSVLPIVTDLPDLPAGYVNVCQNFRGSVSRIAYWDEVLDATALSKFTT